jgi:serine/threonine-protein kinase
MAPEQIRGEVVSPATDVYAAALVLYELLTGRFPWDVDLRNELALAEAHLHRSPAPPSRHTQWVPSLVDQWLLRALSKDPKGRPQDAYEFIAKLYQLQFVNDGTSDSVVDINTTAPTLACLAEAVEDAIELEPSGLVVGTTEPMPPPKFSVQTMERGALATTQQPSGVDRLAPTRTAISATKPAPKNDTPVLSSAGFGPRSAAEAVEPEPLPPIERSPAIAQTPMASTCAPRSSAAPRRSARASAHRGGLLRAAVGLVAIAALFVGLICVRRSNLVRPVAPAADTPPTKSPSPSPQLAVSTPESRPQPLVASSFQVTSPPARHVVHPVAKPTASTHEPDDGRDLLYVRP